MKNLSLRSFLFGLLIMASIGSYAYINTVTVTNKAETTINKVKGEAEEQAEEMVLPDVRLIKKILETSRTLVPSS